MSKIPNGLPRPTEVRRWARKAKPESLCQWREYWQGRLDELTTLAERRDTEEAWRKVTVAEQLVEACTHFA